MAKSALLSTMTPDSSITIAASIENNADAESLPYRTDGVGQYLYLRTIPVFAYLAWMAYFIGFKK